MDTRQQPLFDLRDTLLLESSTYDDGMVAASKALSALDSCPAVDLEPLRSAIAEARHDLAGIAAIVAGSLIESGAATEALRDEILERLLDVYRDAVVFTQRCRDRYMAETGHESCDVCGHDEMEENLDYMAPQIQMMVAEDEPHLEEAWVAVDLISRAAVAVLSREHDERREAASDPDLANAADALSRFHGSAYFVWSLLNVLDDEQLLVLHPTAGVGCRFKMSGVADNFQLHTLLIDALIGGGRIDGKAIDDEAVAVANGTGPQSSEAPVDGVWNLYTYEAVDAFGELPSAHELGGPFWVWNEGVPADIPTFEGLRIVLLGPSAYARSWNSARAFSALPVEFELVDELSAGDVQEWVERLAEHARRASEE